MSIFILLAVENPTIFQTLDCCHGKHSQCAMGKKSNGSRPVDTIKALLPKQASERAGTSWRWPQAILR